MYDHLQLSTASSWLTRMTLGLTQGWKMSGTVSDLLFLGPLSEPIRYCPLTGPVAPPVCELPPIEGWLDPTL